MPTRKRIATRLGNTSKLLHGLAEELIADGHPQAAGAVMVAADACTEARMAMQNAPKKAPSLASLKLRSKPDLAVDARRREREAAWKEWIALRHPE